jgi:type I restriction enzyme S subunit
MSPPLIDIRPDHWAIVRDILQRHVPQYEVWAFGSRATWKAKEYSDLDLAVITDKPLSLAVSAALSDEFSESDLPWKVDVVDWATTSEEFRKIIARDKVVVKEEKERALAADFAIAAFDDLIRRGVLAIGDGYRAKLDELGGTGPIFLRAGLVSDTHISFDGAERFHQYLASKVASKMSKVGDVIITTKGNSTGRVAFVDDSMPPFVYSPHLSYWRSLKHDELSPGYLRYWSRGEEFHRQLRGLSTSTDMAPYLSLADQKRLTISLPAPSEQRRIAHVLGTLDDKIELNRRMNETLEAIARAIFKSWFVDFDPVRAKASGEAPEFICRRLGLTPDLLALFPDRLVDSELGEIPERWEVQSLEPLTNYLNRGLSPKYVEHGGVLVLNQKCIRDGRINSSKARRHDPAQRKIDCRLIEIGDILVNSTGVGTLGRVAQVLGLDEPTIVDSHITVVRADTDKVSWNYLGVAVLERQSEIEALGEGSTGQTELSRARLGALEFLMPPRQLREHFDSIVSGFRLHAKHNDVQSHTLAQIRDALLPKLLSGELRVPDAEAITDDAAA